MIVTNNEIIKENHEVDFVEGSLLDVLIRTRNYVHQGHELITSPIAASGRMHFSPVRTIIVGDNKKEVNEEQIAIIESAITNIRKALDLHDVDTKNFFDYQVIDYELFKSSLKEIESLNISI